MKDFMDQLGKRHNELFDAPVYTGYVTNDMTSNYYFEHNGIRTYVDQFTLQEHFDDDSQPKMPDGEYVNTYDTESLDDIAWALNELASSNYEDLQA